MKRALPDLSIDEAIDQFAMDLRIDKSPQTIETYRGAAKLFERHCRNTNAGDTIQAITPEAIRAWLISLREAGRTESTLFNRYNGLRAFLTWAKAEGLVKENAALAVPTPKPQLKPIPVLTIDQLKAILRAASGQTSTDLRDTAIIRLLADTGMRRAECAGLQLADLDFEQDVAVVTGKGNRVRICPFGPKTAKALRRYLRARYTHTDAHSTALWLGRRGPLQPRALLDILRRRGREAGIERVFVHQLRHSWAHEALRSGLQEGDVMRLGGWKDRDMLNRYGSAGADERARNAYRPVSLGDRI